MCAATSGGTTFDVREKGDQKEGRNEKIQQPVWKTEKKKHYYFDLPLLRTPCVWIPAGLGFFSFRFALENTRSSPVCKVTKYIPVWKNFIQDWTNTSACVLQNSQHSSLLHMFTSSLGVFGTCWYSARFSSPSSFPCHDTCNASYNNLGDFDTANISAVSCRTSWVLGLRAELGWARERGLAACSKVWQPRSEKLARADL